MKQNNKLNILFLTEDFIPIYGGITSVVEKSALALTELGYADITIGTIMAQKKIRKNFQEMQTSYQIVRCKGFKNKITTNMQAYLFDKNFKKKIENEKFDLIHCHFPLGFYKYALKIGRKTKTPVVITAHSIYTPDVKAFIKSKSFANFITKIIVRRLNKADKVFCVSQFCKNHLLKYGLKNDSIVMYNGVDLKKDEEKGVDFDINKIFGLSEKVFVLSVIGRLTKTKNVQMLIHAIAHLKHLNLNLKLLIIGDGKEEKNIYALVKKYKLENNVIMAGAIKDRALLASIYKRTNLIVFPSIGDSAGLIQLEAAFYNKPTLAIKNTAVSELMKDGENGLVAKNTFQDLAERILYAYENPKKLSQIGINANKTLYRTYFDEKVASELLRNYQTVINQYAIKNKKK